LQRVPNTSLRMPPVPPTFGFTWTNAFGSLVFTNPVAIVSPPGETNRLFVVERGGQIVVLTNLASPNRTIFMDLSPVVIYTGDIDWSDEQGLLGLAFHPGYATNGFLYVFYTGNTTTDLGAGRHDTLARYAVSSTNANQGDPDSGQILFAQFDRADNHNAGDVHFGPDGYLYVSLGDEGGSEGQYGNTQRIDLNFFSGIIRLDVDKRATNLAPNPHPALMGQTNYLVPADNPWVGVSAFNGLSVAATNVRTEFYAVGLRNPWRFSFAPDNTLYCGDVGQFTREELDVIEKGKNYGWNFWEGFYQRTNNAQIPPGFVHAPPILDYARNVGYTIIGGLVYQGPRFTQLYGAYIYGDSGSGTIWALRRNGTNVISNQALTTDDRNAAGYAGFSAFGTDPSNGDILYADVQDGTNGAVKRLIYNGTTNGTPLPPTLAATGIFTNLATLAVAPGIVPYDLNVSFWSDNAIKTRWFSVPNTNLTIGFNPDGNWTFPTGTVWIKHFDLEMTNGVPASRQRLETRVLVRNTNGVYGVTYRWGGSTTNAALVGEGGLDESFTLDDGTGVARTQVWHYPSQIECLQCHTALGGYGLGMNTAQFNKDYNYNGTVTNELLALSQAAYFNTNVTGVRFMRALAPLTNTAVSLEYRVRSYLAANCVQCHQPGGSALGLWDARITTPTTSAGLVKGPLVANEGDLNNQLLVPGSLASSMMLTRISSPGGLRMPPLASNLLDTNAINLLSAWITNDLPAYQTFADWQAAHFGTTNAPNAGPTSDPDGDGASNMLEFLTGTDPLNGSSYWKPILKAASGTAQVIFTQVANRAFEVQSTTNFLSTNSWKPLDVAGNAPFYSSSNRTWIVSEPLSPVSSRYYRVRVYAP
jgi:glucose/arabinose dehydrogenase